MNSRYDALDENTSYSQVENQIIRALMADCISEFENLQMFLNFLTVQSLNFQKCKQIELVIRNFPNNLIPELNIKRFEMKTGINITLNYCCDQLLIDAISLESRSIRWVQQNEKVDQNYLVEPAFKKDEEDFHIPFSKKSKLVLIPENLQGGTEVLATCMQEDVRICLYSPNCSLLSLQEKILEMFPNGLSNVAWIFHGTPPRADHLHLHLGDFYFNHLDLNDDEEQKSEKLETFFLFINTLHAMRNSDLVFKRMDIISCFLGENLYAQEFFKIITQKTGIEFAMSTTLKGNIFLGADWILQSHNINVKDIYFTDKIEEYKNLLNPLLIAMIIFGQLS